MHLLFDREREVSGGIQQAVTTSSDFCRYRAGNLRNRKYADKALLILGDRDGLALSACMC